MYLLPSAGDNILTRSQNWVLFPSMIFAIVVVFIFCYIPGLQNTIDTREIPVEYWFLPAAFGIGLLSLDEARKYCVRTWPKGFLAKIAW
jgi:sodium/potassium-transporting ATPase subunit alpha